MNGGGSSSGTQIQKVEPPSWQVPYLQTGMNRAENLYQQGPMTYYPGQTYAGFNPLQTQAQGMATDYASNLTPYLNQTFGTNQALASGQYMNPESNPWLADYAAAATRPIQQNLMEEALPMIRSSAINAGQYGGSRQDLAEGLAVGRAAQAMGDVTSNIYSNAYNQNMQAMLGAQALSPQMAQLGLMPSGILSSVGAEQQGMEQQGINEAIARHEFEQMAPYNQLQNYMSTVGGNMYGSQTEIPYYENPLLGGLGGALTGYGMYNMLGGAGMGAVTGDAFMPAAGMSMWPFMIGGAALGLL